MFILGAILRAFSLRRYTNKKKESTLAKAGVGSNSASYGITSDHLEKIKAVTRLLDIPNTFDIEAICDSHEKLQRRTLNYKRKLEQLQAKGLVVKVEHRDTSVVKHSWHESLATDVKLGRTVAIIGSSGNGKSYGVKHVLEGLGYNIYHMDCTDSVTVDQLVAGITPEPDGVGGIRMVFKEGLFAKAFSDPNAAIQLDEYDALDPRVAMSLQSALHRNSKGRWLSCQDHPSGGIRAVGVCPIVVTMNTFGDGPTREYVGRNSLDAANKDRFDTIIIADYENEEQILESNGFNPKIAKEIVNTAKVIRGIINEKALRVILSTRRLLNIAECVQTLEMSVKGAFERDFFNRLDHIDKESFKNFLAGGVQKQQQNVIKGERMKKAPPAGSIVKVVANSNSHNYKIGGFYFVHISSDSSMRCTDDNGHSGNNLMVKDAELVISSQELISSLIQGIPLFGQVNVVDFDDDDFENESEAEDNEDN